MWRRELRACKEMAAMPDLVFVAVCIVGAFVLAMRRAPLWAWTIALAAAVYVWQSGLLYGEANELEPGFLLRCLRHSAFRQYGVWL